MESEILTITSKGKSVDEAVFKGLQQMGISIDEVNINIIQTETKGILGIGAKPAIVELTKKAEEEFDIPDYMRREERYRRNGERRNGADRREKQQPKPEKKREEKPEPVKENKPEPKPEKKREEKTESKNEKPRAEKPAEQVAEKYVKAEEKPAEPAEKQPERKQRVRNDRKRGKERVHEAAELIREEREAEAEAEAAPAKPIVYTKEAAENCPAADFVKGLIEHMGATGEVLAAQEEDCLRLRIDSEMMGMLIGHRGETLDAMQYLTGLVINKNRKTEGYTRVTLNTEEYREKREETLKRLARKVAAQVRATGRARALEPMNPYERRVLHSALQNNPDVTTHSEGEEPNRRVVVSPRRAKTRSGSYARATRSGRREDRPRAERPARERRPRPAEDENEGSIDLATYNELLEAARKGVVSRVQYEEMFASGARAAEEKTASEENSAEIPVENFENS